MDRNLNLAVIVLAGGQSQRMGQDKRSIQIESRSLLDRVLSSSFSISGQVIVVGVHKESPHESVEQYPKAIWLNDEFPDRGPIEGIRTGMQWLAKQGREHLEFALVIGCDNPLFEPQVATRMLDQIGDYQVACLTHDKHRIPIPAVYRTSVASSIEQLIDRHQFALKSLLDQVKTIELKSEAILDIDPPLNSLLNINRPEDIELIRQRF